MADPEDQTRELQYAEPGSGERPDGDRYKYYEPKHPRLSYSAYGAESSEEDSFISKYIYDLYMSQFFRLPFFLPLVLLFRYEPCFPRYRACSFSNWDEGSAPGNVVRILSSSLRRGRLLHPLQFSCEREGHLLISKITSLDDVK